jgi:hypothetical protein
VLEANLENDIKLIIVSQKGMLIPYWINRPNWNNTHYLEIHYKIHLMANNPIVLFEEKNLNKESI